MRGTLWTIAVVGMLVGLASGCSDAPTAIVDPPQYYEGIECNPDVEPDCVLRAANYSEMLVLVAAYEVYASNDCTELASENGWGTRLEIWDAHIRRWGVTVNGDYHRWNDKIHLWSGSDNIKRTYAHELLHRKFPNWTHSAIVSRAEFCSAELQ
jgi:hypothetical protein